jgi:Ca-activated chloride channel homolog
MAEEDFTGKGGQKVDRLSAAKEILDEFLTRRKGDRAGLIVFGNAAFVQVPFTEDLDVCRQLLAETVPRMAGPKTAFGDAIGLGITLFERGAVKRRVMIALTDGNHTGSQVPPAEAAQIAKDKGIVIHTVAMGDPTTVGEDKLDEEALRAVAQATGGQYFSPLTAPHWRPSTARWIRWKHARWRRSRIVPGATCSTGPWDSQLCCR